MAEDPYLICTAEQMNEIGANRGDWNKHFMLIADVNMGAYGGTAEASKSYFGEPLCETIIAGDVNGDCKVDFTDIEILLVHWLEEN